MAIRGEPAASFFVDELHRALLHLYHPAELRRSPLVEMLGASRREDPTAALRTLLTEAIRALRPPANVPPQANAWRLYHILSQRYVENFAPGDIAASLAVSERQLRRLHAMALQALADYLWAAHDLGASPAQEQGTLPTASIETADDPEAQTHAEAEELAWLKRSCPSETTAAEEVIQSALAVAEPLARALQVRLEWSVPDEVPRLAVQLTAFRHALLSILTAAIRSSRGGSIRITAEAHLPQVWVCVQARAGSRAALLELTADTSESLKIARELAALCGGRLEMGAGVANAATVRLILPAAAQLPVLVIDDNRDALQLYERYLTDTRYRFVGVSDPRNALATAAELGPQVIVLDLMLPQVDGWELLGRLRAHPRTRHIPIIICSILPQEDLALALGAAMLLRKPVNQQTFVAALDSQLAPASPESR